MRQLAALAIVAALVLAVPLGDMAAKAAFHHEPQVGEEVRLDARFITSAASSDEVLERLEAFALAGGSVPTWFQDEIGLLPGARDVRSGASIVGYLVDGEADETCALLEANMTQRGWSCAPLGGVEGFTCMRPSGSCTWAMVTCTQVGAATSVVTRCKES